MDCGGAEAYDRPPAVIPRFRFSRPVPAGPIALSLRGALPISRLVARNVVPISGVMPARRAAFAEPLACEGRAPRGHRSEEHTAELQSHHDRVCRPLLEKKKANNDTCAVLHP